MTSRNIASLRKTHPMLKEHGYEGVKAMFDLPELICQLTGNNIKPTQSDYCQLDDDVCPFCGHKGCFKIYHTDSEEQHYHCYSCNKHGDIFGFLVTCKLAKNAYDAANKLLSGEIKGVTINTQPRPQTTRAVQDVPQLTPEQLEQRQALLEDAWEYYWEPMIEKDSKPLSWLMAKRKLSSDTLIDLGIGYSRGELWRHLTAKGYDLDELYDSGLVQKGQFSPRDYFPKDVYIFPHYDEQKHICRFTFKDPTKAKQFQLPKKYWLNDIQFYGQDTMDRSGCVALVEGEHDLLALVEHGWQGPVLATNGQLGQSQLNWLAERLKDRQLVTFFDNDDAGNKYRERVAALGLPSLIQVTLPEGHGKDIDEYLRGESPLSLEELVSTCGTHYPPAEASPEEASAEAEDTPAATASIWDSIDPNTFNDVGNAKRLSTLWGRVVAFVPEFGQMYRFKYNIWEPTMDSELQAASEVGNNIIKHGMMEKCAAAAANEEEAIKLADKYIQFGRKSLERKKLADMLEIYKSSHQIKASTFNCDPMKFGVRNGVIDLNTAKPLAPSPEMYISRCSEVSYDESAICPRWEQFIDEITCGDKEYGQLLQRIVGYTLTGRTDEQVMFFLHGHGCNGKSTFMNILQRLMGSYYHQISSDVLLQTNGSGKSPNPSIAKLVGSRLVVANELPEGSRMDENLVKSMTGDDIIVARHLYAKHELEYRPMFTLMIIGNHKPVIRDTSPGMWRRMILLPFNASFTGNQLDPKLMEKLYAELPGILNWAIKGVQMWLERSIKGSLPASIQAGIDEYRHESDLLANFLEEMTISEPESYIATDELYDAFRRWAERDSDWKMTRNIMTKRLKDKGFTKVRKQNKACIQGLMLKPRMEGNHDFYSSVVTAPEPKYHA
ncbi:phage/plasmid primase, P4 family [Shewanella algae]|uniref:phage/plasmid primase, P4 family n=1 Tax=Shewanella algae TaxID=38313 RepID=UPI0031F59AB2